jgi:hypothetical protein
LAIVDHQTGHVRLTYRRLAPLPLVSILTLAGCSRTGGNPAPPRIPGGDVGLPQQSSTIVVPVEADLNELQAGIDKETPRTLWTIDEHRDKCVKAKRVDLGIGRVKVTPDLGCRIVGQVTRGPIKLGGTGDRLTIVMPVRAEVGVRNLGGVVNETATGTATVRATGRLSVTGDWRPTAKISIAYDWREPPGINIIGQRIEFTSRADEKLHGVIAKLERDLPQELEKLKLRRHLEAVWRQAFTTIELSHANPPAWMRVAPRRLGFGGYRIEGRRLRMTLAAQALTETFVGNRPADPAPTPLPPPSRATGAPGLRFFIPVLADYAQLEPVVQRALRKLAAKGIVLSGVGPVDAEFGDVTVYATTGNRLAVGVKTKVKARAMGMASTSGEVWLSAVPYNDPGSQLVQAREVQFATRTDSDVVDMLVTLFDNPEVRAAVTLALRHDFAPDYAKVLAKAQAAIGERREGDFILSATITEVRNGRIRATGDGLFMPVEAQGEARIEYRPTSK